MAAQATIAINDGQGTPVSHDFDPAGLLDGIARYEDRVGGIPAGFPVITASLRRPSKASKAYKVMLKVSIPTLETAGGGGTFEPPPTVAYNTLFVGEFVLPERGTAAERADIIAYAKNLLAHAVVTSMVEDLEPVY